MTRTHLVTLREALTAWQCGRTSYYAKIDPSSSVFDSECPIGFQLGDHANSKRVFPASEVASYAALLIERGRTRTALPNAASRERAQKLVAARQQRRSSSQPE